MFAEGLEASADQTRRRMLALTDVQNALHVRVQDSAIRTANARCLVDLAVAKPSFTVSMAADELGVRYPGAKKLVDSLVEIGVLAELGERSYNRRFHAPEVLRVLLSESEASTSGTV